MATPTCRTPVICIFMMMAAVGALSLANCTRAPRRPNVVLITIDTLRADALGCYGADADRTPHIDGLARAGILFENANCPMPLTRPSHSSIMTSQYPREHGVMNNHMVLPPSALTLAEVFQKAGYHTRGFVSANLIEEASGIAQGFEVFSSPRDHKTWTAGEGAPQAARWIKDYPDRPFFLWVHIFDPHMPYEPPPEYRPRTHPQAPRIERLTWDVVNKIADEHGGDLPSSVVDEGEELYAGEVRYADHAVGDLLKALDERGLTGSTAVALTADHGECVSHGVLFSHSECMYDGATHVPLILRFPAKLSAGHVASEVENVDIAPTLLELAGIEVPPSFHGRSLLHDVDADRSGFVELPVYPPGGVEHRQGKVARVTSVAGQPLHAIASNHHVLAVRTARWKYLRSESDHEELYDLHRDPKESENLAPAHEDVTAQMRARLQKWEAAYPLRVTDTGEIAPDTLESLRALGYVQ